MKNPVFAVIITEDGFKYQTDIVENELISKVITDTAFKHGRDHYTTKVYDASVFDWLDVHQGENTNPDIIPDNILSKYIERKI
jgi:hypothetical protein